MKIKTILNNLWMFVESMRKSGTSTLLKKIASENDVWILVPDNKQKEEFGRSAITFEDLKNMKGTNPKPIFLDNYTLLKLSEMSIDELEYLNDQIKRRNKLITNIKDSIMEFERNELSRGIYLNEKHDN